MQMKEKAADDSMVRELLNTDKMTLLEAAQNGISTPRSCDILGKSEKLNSARENQDNQGHIGLQEDG